MSTDTKRRLFLKASLSAGAVGIAVGAGLLAPGAVLAAWDATAFKAESDCFTFAVIKTTLFR